MTETASTFIAKSAIRAADLEHRRKINFNIGKYNEKTPEGKAQFADLGLARERAKNIKWRAIETLDQQLEEFELNFTKRGGHVIWAENTAEAIEAILTICKERDCKTLVKSKSMVTEEIHLNAALENNGIKSIETDLGEYIQQLDGEAPYHIVTPAMHKSKEDVAKLFAEKLGTSPQLTPQQLTLVARDILRKKYVEAEVGVTGANFIISNIGGIAITENEGNARLSCAFPATHIVVAGIEKVIPFLSDLGLFWPLLSSYGTGQQVTVYNSIVTGPRQQGETDGPVEMFVILLDNGRTNILQDPKQRESLYCIRCGACLNACPIYKNIGGHAYGAFMTANLLAHTALFKAGIARSGAYNRTLTPFGFQAEERTYWQAPELYFKMSPFSYANQIKVPLLLIHGENDDNSGTFPIQSERLYSAIKGFGGKARLVYLPYEAHSYKAKESVLHMLYEMDAWLEKYVKNK
jgi:L-lactate dehydrogenase complex protein LldF